MGYGDLACYGHPHFKTPNIDQMAREGARLTSFYSSCPYCAPARASLLTGRYPFRSGIVLNPVPDKGVNDIGMPASEITLGESLQSAGYRTACIGKWHLGHVEQFFPTRHGFDEYFGILYSNDMRPVSLWENEEQVEYPVEQSQLTRRYTERAIQFLQANRERPFFLYLPHAMPHKPLAASEQFAGKSGAGLYGDVLAELDWSVGRILEEIKSLDLDKRTLVIFASDNGPWFGGSSGPLRGMKSQAWEGGLRVPCIARWPGVIPEGHESDEPAIVMDLFTTILQACGAKVPDDRTIDGRDIMPLWTSDAPSPHTAIFSVQEGTLRSIRAGRWKLHPLGTPEDMRVRPNWVDPRAPDGTTILAPAEQYGPDAMPGLMTGDHSDGPALFDLVDDPGEQHDVAGAHPDIVARLTKDFESMQMEVQREMDK